MAMVTDKVALAFAAWLEAHKKHVEAQRRLAEAERIAGQMGMLPPQVLIDEVRALAEDAKRLLAAVEAAIRSQSK
jgi:hypothetical protein